MHLLLLLAVFVIATCGLIYELVAGTLASYLLGDSVMQFSTVIGVYLFAMGIGSFLSKYLRNHLLTWFIRIEFLVALVGGFSAVLLFLLFPVATSFRILLYMMVLLTGILVGLEIPLLMRILKDKIQFTELVSQVFTFDYIGALLASVIFPLVLVPQLGLMRTSLFFGMLNAGVGLFLCIRFSREIRRAGSLKLMGVLIILSQAVTFAFADQLMQYSETLTFNDPVIYAHSSPYQRIVLTRNKKEWRLFLNGNLQFATSDEYRYHEALVHPAMHAVASPKRILILGGGDGLAAREVLRYPSVRQIMLVDLDASMTHLFSTSDLLIELNRASLKDPRVQVINADAFQWLRSNQQQFDVVIVDFPDPSNYSVGKLYSYSFYQLLRKALLPGAVTVIQSTSPFAAPKSYWCVNTTLEAAGFKTVPYHNYVPSFGEWGYILAGPDLNYQVPDSFISGLHFISPEVMRQMMVFPEDMRHHGPLAVNKLNNQELVHYFETEWNQYLRQ